MNRCPHPDCKRSQPVKVYACRLHWFSLPKAIREQIWKGWRHDAALWDEAHRKALAFWARRPSPVDDVKPRPCLKCGRMFRTSPEKRICTLCTDLMRETHATGGLSARTLSGEAV